MYEVLQITPLRPLKVKVLRPLKVKVLRPLKVIVLRPLQAITEIGVKTQGQELQRHSGAAAHLI